MLANPTTATTTPASSLDDGKAHLLLVESGSVAVIKIPEIAKAFPAKNKLSIRIILTQSAKHFLAGQSEEQPMASSLMHIPGVDAVYDNESEWGPEPWRRGAKSASDRICLLYLLWMPTR